MENKIVKKCRFAPSPTGFLHVGNIRAAIVNALYAKKVGGEFILRLDDTDTQRVKDEYRLAIIEDLSWLGLEYDEIFKQSDRLELYEKAKEALIKANRLYECYETAEELELQRKIQINSGKPPIYDRRSLKLTNDQKEELKKQGIKPHYRFLLNNQKISWNDKIKGQILYDGLHFSDPVLIRDNGVPTYTFCSVVDDIAMNITDIIRGEDHITNTAIQIQIFEALGCKAPEFAHLALIKASSGKISKREGGFDIKSLRNEGYEPMTIINFLSQIGTSDNIKIYSDINQLVENFDLAKYSKSSTNYDINELVNINHKLLQKINFSQLKNSLNIHNLQHIDESLFLSLRENISFITDLNQWYQIIKSNFRHQNQENDIIFLQEISKLLPANTNNINSWEEWLNNIKNWQQQSHIKDDSNLNRKGKSLFLPIRLALTGLDHGPEMKIIISLIKREEIIARITNNSK